MIKPLLLSSLSGTKVWFDIGQSITLVLSCSLLKMTPLHLIRQPFPHSHGSFAFSPKKRLGGRVYQVVPVPLFGGWRPGEDKMP